LNPVLSISSPGFQKSSPGFFKHESGFFPSWGPGFSRVRIFLESGFRSMLCVRDKGGFYIVLYWLFGTPILAGFDRVMYGRQCGQSRFLDVGCLMTVTHEHLNSVLSKSVLLNTAQRARERENARGYTR
jgi:hypothetical protein